MEVFDAVRTVLAVRDYRPEPVPDDVVRRIVEAGHLTASSMNRQPWHFVVVDEPDMLRRLGESLPSGPYITGAPLAVAILIERDSRFAVSDASRAAQSMILAAWSEGVGSNWVGFHASENVAALLGVPEKYDVLAVLSFGFPRFPGGKGEKKRKPLAEVVSRGRFGRPLI